MIDINLLEQKRFAWSMRAFPEATAKTSLIKLAEELIEVAEELEKYPHEDDKKLLFEYADCLMCLFDSAGRAGITTQELFGAFKEKFEINKKRSWTKNPDNTYSHIKESNHETN